MTNSKMEYSAPEFKTVDIEVSSVIMESVTGNSSTESLTEETFEW